MALEGNLQDFGLADILQLIYFQKKTGILSLRSKIDAVRILFSGGNVVGASSKRREESNRIGRMLVQRGLLGELDLQAALEKSRASAERLGRVLVDSGKVGVEDIRAALSEQVTQTVVQIFNWKEGHYEFIPQDVTVDSVVSISIDTDQLLMEGLRVTDEWTLYDGKVALTAIYKPAALPEEPLEGAEALVLTHIDGRNDVNEIMDLTALDQIEAARAIVSLVDKGYIQELVVTELEQAPVVTGRGGRLEKTAVYACVAGFLVLLLGIGIFQSRGVWKVYEGFSRGVAIERVRRGLDLYKARSGQLPESLAALGNLSHVAEEAGLRYEPGQGRAGYVLVAPPAEEGGFTEPIR